MKLSIIQFEKFKKLEKAKTKVEINGIVCAGKKIHTTLLDSGNIGVQSISAKYIQECQLMSDLRHPNITQFLGVCFLPDSQLPMLVTEKLDGNLDDLLETVSNIPTILKISWLEDIARGLHYLHSHDPQIVHRDLTAKNVLLNSSLVAKITDLGNSRIVNIQPGQLAQTLSQNPGTLMYMPPEALTVEARYGPSLDIFSFGHLGIFVGLQTFPDELLEPTYLDPENHERLLARSEVERRQNYVEQLENKFPSGEQHAFVQLIRRCLHNDNNLRPTSEELLTTLEALRADIEGSYGDIARADAIGQLVMTRVLKKRDLELMVQTNESAIKDDEIHRLQQELEYEQAERARAEVHLQHANEQLHLQNINLQHKDQQIHQKEVEIQQARSQLQQKDVELCQKDIELNNSQQHLERACAEVLEKDAQLRAQSELLHQKDSEIGRLMRELRSYQPLQSNGQQLLKDKSDWEENSSKLVSKGHLEQTQQTPLVELAIPLTLRWKQGRDMPFTMTNSIQAVVIDNQVYVGGGYNFDNGRGVMLYTLHTGSWRTLPRYDSVWFGMAPVNNQLVLVGGAYSSTNRISDILGVWDEGLRMWTHPYPVMPTPRSQVSVVSYHKWLIVAGGLSGGPLCLSNVEILDTSSRQWYEAGSLPIACCAMSSTRNGNMWYLSRGSSSMMSQASNHVFSVNLDNLIAEAVSCSDGVSTPSPWQSLPDTPLVHSTVIVIGGALLTVGGWKSSSIHLYQPSHKRWVKVGELPCMRYQCACAVLPSGELFVTGGCGDIYRVDIATVTSNE